MQKSKTYLPDVNSRLTVCVHRHAHHEAASAWFEHVGPRESAFCRVTQMGLLRLLTNSELSRDSRVTYVEEPDGIEVKWTAGSGRWTDAYLHALASLRDMRVVTFDRGFAAFGEPPAEVLSPQI